MTDMLADLSSFDPALRRRSLKELASKTEFPPESQDVNMHLHTFFSYHGEGWSPTQVAYEMKKLGIYSAAICDFDVLQGMEEFLAATDLLALRGAVGYESRVFFREYSQVEINSPGEPGVLYFMGMGFVRMPPKKSKAERILQAMLEQSHFRNRALIERVNRKIAPLQLNYDREVLPLTPEGNATERHLVRAYYELAKQQFAGIEGAAKFWSSIFKLPLEEVKNKLADLNRGTEFLRGKLLKRGGLGYEQPTEKTFPRLEEVIGMILECRAIPMVAWLDGSLAGEQDPAAQLDCLLDKQVEAVNDIPDSNWNFADPVEQTRKISALEKYLSAVQARELPVNVGTEGNKPGQRLVDDFNCPALAKYRPLFLQGAQIMVGHTRLLRFADFSYSDQAAKEIFPERRKRNEFFAAIGALPCPEPAIQQNLQALTPEKAFACLADCGKRQSWS